MILRLRRVNIVVKVGVLLLRLVVVVLRRRVMVVEVEALVRVRACVGRIGGDGLQHVGRGAGRLLARLGAADDGDLDEAQAGQAGRPADGVGVEGWRRRR